ncbi:DJ-1/PfpI family protein [Gammaproteobacteria bacterium]|nr:DJ-1/PfpI family protein [Gammaproteobacteria bacterium]
MRIVVLLFDAYTALDIVGGYEILARLPSAKVEFTAGNPGIVVSDTRQLALVASSSIKEIKNCDILYVPGGPGIEKAMVDPDILQFIRHCHQNSTWTVGVCNGVQLLGKAGILKDVTVTTNYFAREELSTMGGQSCP